MIEALASVAVAVITINCAFLAWNVRTLWDLDRRLVRLETRIGLSPMKELNQ